MRLTATQALAVAICESNNYVMFKTYHKALKRLMLKQATRIQEILKVFGYEITPIKGYTPPMGLPAPDHRVLESSSHG